MPPTRPRRARLAALLSAALALTGLQFLILAPAAQADVSTKIATFPYTQDWSTLTATSTWADFPGVEGFTTGTSIAASNQPNTTDVGTLTAEGTLASSLIQVTGALPSTTSTGGVLAFAGAANKTVALGATGAVTTPLMVFHLDTTGQTGVGVAYDIQDLDSSADNQPTRVALQYRVGTSGAYTNVPGGYVADATVASNAAVVSTPVSATLPATADNQADVYVRVITLDNASGSNEHIGIDNVAITTDTGQLPLTAADPGDKTALVGQPIASFTLSASGGSSPYTWSDQTLATLPPGVTVASNGQVSGTPTQTGTYEVSLTVTDSATPNPATDTVSFTFTIYPAAGATNTIAEIQGTGASTPYVGQTVTTAGLVTASYATGGLNGFYLQTPGADTANASDAIFIYGGTGGFATYPAIGASVSVTGTAGEFSGQTQITTNDAGVTGIADLPGSVTPKTTIPGADCGLPGTACATIPNLNIAREVAEGEAFQPTGDFTATDVYDFSPFITFDGGSSNGSSMFGEIGLAAHSDMPLVSPTEIIDAQATAPKNERIAYNNAHRIVLDDGSSMNYTTAANTDKPFPWLTATHHVRVGAAVTFPAPVIFTYGFNTWRLIPSSQVVGVPNASTQPQFEQTRAAIASGPEDVGGDLKLATFNVLNFFPTTGEEFVISGLGTCSYFTDRAGNPITNNSCNPNGPRGAANEVNLVRQRDKIVAAINTANADIVSLEELENSVKFNKDRDFAINELVTALNADAGPGTWAAVPSPAAGDLPLVAEQDVIRNGFIYRPASVALVGSAMVLADQSSAGEAFEDAREPLAQAFKEVGTPDAGAFAVIVNHFKSKGSGNPDPDGQGNANDRRIIQANALVTFADSFKALRSITRVFLAGDFNAYSSEDPIQVLNAAGYTNLESTSDPEEESYNFDGQIGSLDHVLANAVALADVAAVDIWPINAYESVYYEYSRHNYNATNLYNADPFRSSDHNPELVGINTAAPAPVEPVLAVTAPTMTYGKSSVVTVNVSATGQTPTGTVQVRNGATVLGTGTVTAGTASITLPARSLSPGTVALTAVYSGDATVAAKTQGFSQTVVKATPAVSVKVKPGKIKAGKTKARIKVTVTADGVVPVDGKVRITVKGQGSKTITLKDGKAKRKLKVFHNAGKRTVKVKFLGSEFVEVAKAKGSLNVI